MTTPKLLTGTVGSLTAGILAGGVVVAEGIGETPVSIVAAFIGVTVSMLGLLGWVLREQMKTNREYCDRLGRTERAVARIEVHLRMSHQERGGEDHHHQHDDDGG